ncbi:MAG: GAF domain-containing protein [Anaerolineae bacterium]|nr:GAF domain-containing protein [Anaerolineae bacterium]
MTPAVFTDDVAEFFVHSGWRKFFLDEQFYLLPPYPAPAKLSGFPPESLKNKPFASIFDPSEQDKLNSLLSQLASNPDEFISAAMLIRPATGTVAPVVEFILYPAGPENPQARYAGFIRPMPHPAQETLKHKQSPSNIDLAAIAQFGHHLATFEDLDTLLNDTARILNQDFGYDYVSIFLADAEETTLLLKSIVGVDLPAIPPDLVTVPITNQTTIGHAAAIATPILVNNFSQHNYLPLDCLPRQPQSELAIPLFTGKQVLGILHLQSPDPDYYQEDDLLLLEILASQLAIAIENTRLLEERDRRMAELVAFNQIGLVIAEFSDLETIFLNIVQRINALFQVEAVSLLLLEGDNLRFVAASGTGAEKITSFILKPGQGIAWSVVETGQTIRVDDVQADPRHFKGIDKALNFITRSLLAVPIQIQDRVLGVIEAINRLDGRPFSREDEVTLEFIVSSVAIAIENGRLFGQLQRHVQRVEGLLDASHALNTLDLKDILDTIVQRASILLVADLTVVYLADYQARQLNATATFSTSNMKGTPTPSFKFEQGTVGWVFKHQQPLRINDVSRDERFTYISTKSHLISNLISIPLTVKGEAIGVIEAAHKIGGEEFTAQDEALLSAFASQAAVAIYNARLFLETNQRLAEVSTLYTLAQQLTKALALDNIVESSVFILQHALDCSGCCILLRQEDDPEPFLLKACSGWPDRAHKGVDLDFIIQLSKNLLERPNPIYVQNVPEALSTGVLEHSESMEFEEENYKQIQLGSVMMIPLLVKQELLGVLSITDKQPQAFDQAEGRLLTIAAAQISAAIENARLYDHLEQRAVELEAALQEVEAVNRLKTEFVENVSHELRTPLTFIKAYVALILEEKPENISAEARDRLKIIAQKTEAIIRLVEDLVLLQKIEAKTLKLEPIAVSQLIAQVADGASAGAAEHNIKLVANSAPNLPEVLVDVARIGQVFDNLIGNAIKFSPAGSKINIMAQQDGQCIKFSVQDWGRGIPADKLDKIFNRFYQVETIAGHEYSGTGLGLTIVKQIVEAHNGQITVESEVNKGSTFSFWLPIGQEPAANSVHW